MDADGELGDIGGVTGGHLLDELDGGTGLAGPGGHPWFEYSRYVVNLHDWPGSSGRVAIH
jgi:hypothetical protein